MTENLDHDIKLMRKGVAVYIKKRYYRMLLKMSHNNIKILWSIFNGKG